MPTATTPRTLEPTTPRTSLGTALVAGAYTRIHAHLHMHAYMFACVHAHACRYGSRGWCRVEYFIFGLFSEMRISRREMRISPTSQRGGGSGAPLVEVPPLALFASGSDGAPQQFKAVEFLGGDRGDMHACIRMQVTAATCRRRATSASTPTVRP